MNFYKRYPADYGKKTARLTLAEHGAYTLLLDELYCTESGLPDDMEELYRVCRAMTKPEQIAVRKVAEQFFPVGIDGLRHNRRATAELIEARNSQEAARIFWASISPADRAAMQARRRASEMQASPPWQTDDDLAKIAKKYKEARQLSIDTGIPHEVDHIIPLQGRNVRGLHVVWNLQVVTATENRQKGRSYGG